MPRILIIYCLLSLMFLGVISCEKKVQIPSNKVVYKDSTGVNMIKLNALLTDVEANEIKAFIDSSEIKWQYDSIGFWYVIKSRAGQKPVEKEATVLVDYQVNTLQGDTCYLFKAEKSRTIVVGKSRHERGFNFGLMKMKEGDSALFVIPSQLAYGLLGDKKQILPRATLIYKVSSVKLK